MAQVDIYIGTYGYLAYLWADNLKKFVKVAMPSVDIEYLDKQMGIAHIQKSPANSEGKAIITAAFVDIESGVSLKAIEDQIDMKSNVPEQLVKFDQECVDAFLQDLSEIPIGNARYWYSHVIRDIKKSVGQRPQVYYKFDSRDPKFAEASQKWVAENREA